MNRAEIEQRIVSRPTAFVASADEAGYSCMKAMLAPRVREGLRVFYFTTDTHSMRVAQYRRNSRAGIYCCDEERFVGVMLCGEMETLTDAASREAVWRDGDTEYDPLGVDDPDDCVLRFTARGGRTYAGCQSENFTIE